MQLEIHVLQSFPPANLNRDENGMPKSTVFGGRPRARISSQCQKRATRLYYQEYSELNESLFAKRSKDWATKISEELEGQRIEKSLAELAATCTISVFTEKKDGKGKVKKKEVKNKESEAEEQPDKSDTSLYLGNSEFQAIMGFLNTHWEQVVADISGDKPAFSKQILDGIQKTVEAKAKPGDVALFGRMMANLPSGKVDAAVQVAHAISVHALQQEFDFFTAVDELAKPDSTGADHLGEMGFNGSTYYRFAILDIQQLIHNLGETKGAKILAEAFAEAFVRATPTGHQHQCAHHTKPAMVMLVVRNGQPISLVDAFEKVIRPSYDFGLLEEAVERLDNHWQTMVDMYGEYNVQHIGVLCPEFKGKLKALKEYHVQNEPPKEGEKSKGALNTLINQAIAAAFPESN
jgi:CRISPR system Cascade subunit CasC